MTRSALFIVIIPLAALAAPVPKTAENIREWGEPVDPLKECKFEASGGKLTMTVPGKGLELDISLGNMNAPRVVRETEGNFILEVTVDGQGPKKAKSLVEQRAPYFEAGLHIAKDDQNYLQLGKIWVAEGDYQCCYMGFALWKNGELHLTSDFERRKIDPGKPVKLRIGRYKDSYKTQFSEDDGKNWISEMQDDIKFDNNVKVGVSTVNTTNVEFKPTFSDFKLEKREAAKP